MNLFCKWLILHIATGFANTKGKIAGGGYL